MHVNDFHDNIKATLENLAEEAGQLLLLGYQLKREVEAALERIEPAPGRPVDLTTAVRQATFQDLIRAIFDGRGERSAALARTRIHQTLESRRGRRLSGGGQDRVARPNGRDGRHAKQLELDL